MSSDGSLTLIAITFCIFAHIASSNGTANPSVYISAENDPFDTENYKITCYSYQAFDKCVFKVFDLIKGYYIVPTLLKKRPINNSYYSYDNCDLTLDLKRIVGGQYYTTTCRIRSDTSDWSYASKSLRKSEAPYLPIVLYRIEEGDNGSATLHGTCTVLGSRPVPEVFWFLDNDYIPEINVIRVSDNWKWPSDEQAVIVQLNLKLDASHIGRTVFCRSYNSEFKTWTNKNEFQIGNFTTRSTVTPTSSYSTSTTPKIVNVVTTVTTRSAVTPTSSDSTSTTSKIIDDITTAPPPTPILPDSTQPTASVTTTDSSATSELLSSEMKCNQQKAGEGSNPTWLYVVIALLASLLILVISLVVFYAWQNKLFCFARANNKSNAPVVKYRRSINASVEYEETRRQTMSSVDRSSAVTGLEYAEIRVSMVQRCVDKIAANTSAETGEMQEESIRPNSLYQSFDEKL